MDTQQQQQQQQTQTQTQTHSAAPQQPGGRDTGKIRALFRKTELCTFYAKRRCVKGETCRFAHGEEELNQVPDLTKTSLCRNWLKRTCALTRRECPFAHGTCDLRRGAAGSPEQAAGARSHEFAAKIVVENDSEPSAGDTHPVKPEDSTQALHLAVHLFGAAPAPGGFAAGGTAAPAPPSAAPGPDAGHIRRFTPSPAGAVPPPPPCAVAIVQGWHVVAVQPVSPCNVAPVPTPVLPARGAWEAPAPQAHCLELLRGVVKRAAVSSDAELEALLLQAAPEHYED